MIEGRRVEVKSAQLAWDAYKRYWKAKWQKIKRNAYDDLLLVLYTPLGVHLFLHDHVYGVTTTGKSQSVCGGNVQVCGRKDETCIFASLDVILGKLNHMHYASLSFTDLGHVTTTITHDAYVGVPLGTHSLKARGDILEVVAMQVMEKKMGA